MTEKPFWYRGECSSARVDFFTAASDKKPRTTKDISDPDMLRKMIDLIDQLPLAGDKMIKMSATTPRIKLSLTCDGSIHEINFYSGRVKTPDTSFFSEEIPAERALVNALKALDR